MNNEFLRFRENRCKWFNNLEVEKKSVYVVKGEKTQFSHKNNILNRFMYLVNRFRHQEGYAQTQERYENWCKSRDIWNDSSRPHGWMNRFRESQRVWWYDSRTNETIQTWIDSYAMWINSWIDSFRVRDFFETIQIGLSRFKWIQDTNERVPTWIVTSCFTEVLWHSLKEMKS